MYDTKRESNDEFAVMRAAFELVHEPVFVVDARSGRIVDANPAACDALAIAHDGLIGCRWSAMAGHFGQTTLYEVDGRWMIAVAHRHPTDRIGSGGLPRDALTGLATRDALLALIASEIDGEPRARLSLLFIDLDRFKQVNDQWGHVAGDRVLRIVAERLLHSVRPDDLVVRYGGDEFLVVVEGVSRRRDLERLARRIARGIQQPISVAGREITVSASVGIAQRKSRAQSIELLVAEADRAMYGAKWRNRAPAAELPAIEGFTVCHAN